MPIPALYVRHWRKLTKRLCSWQLQEMIICEFILLYLALVLTIVSLIDYLVKNKEVMKEQK